MESLLRWGIENSDDTGVRPQQALDPGVIDVILGKPDAVLMKESLEVALDEERDLDERVVALEDLENLVENIDNANDLSKLRIWEPLFTLLTLPTSPNPIKLNVLWIMGTAMQNNPTAQASYSDIAASNRPLAALLVFLNPSTSEDSMRSKAVYALSGLLKHHAAAVTALGDSTGWTWAADVVGRDDGWAVLISALKSDPSAAVRRKVAFLLSALLTPGNAILSSSSPDIVHPNSHASMLKNPRSAETSMVTMRALEDDDGRLLNVVVGLLEDVSLDSELGENLVRLLYSYAVLCRGQVLMKIDRKAMCATLDQRYGEGDIAVEASALKAVLSC